MTLIVLGGRNGDTDGAATGPVGSGGNTQNSSPGNDVGDSTTQATLPSMDMTAEALSELSGLVFPDDIEDFRSVALDDDLQYDLTFIMSESAVDTFVEESGLPALTEGQRALIHASPLWDLNPPDGATISSSQDRYEDVNRAVEVIAAGTADAGEADRADSDGGGTAGSDGSAATSTTTTQPLRDGQVRVRVSLTPAA